VDNAITNPFTDEHIFWIDLNKNNAVFSVDGEPVAIIIHSTTKGGPTGALKENTVPYSIGFAPHRAVNSNFRWWFVAAA